MKKFVFCSVFFLLSGNLYSIIISPAKIEFITGQTVNCEIVEYGQSVVYFSINNHLFFANLELIKSMYYKDRKIDPAKLDMIDFDQMDFGKFLSSQSIKNEGSISTLIDPALNPMSSGTPDISNPKNMLFQSGKSLKNFSYLYYAGISSSLIGTIMISQSKNQGFGIGFSIVGFIFLLFAPDEISQAGDYLIEYSKTPEPSKP